MNYSVDTYLLLASPKMGYIREFISSGRIITALFFLIMGVLHLPHYLMYLMSFILAITITTLTIYELNSVLEKYIKNKLLALLLPILIIINPFVIELWLFIEMGIMMLSIFACVKAYKHFDSYLLTKDKKEIKNIFIYMLLAVFSYQGTLAIFIALCAYSTRYIVNYEDKQIVKQVEEKVKQYEAETGNEVKYLAVYNKENSKKFYPDLVDSFNVSSKNEDPSGLALYVYYNDRKIESKDENNEIYNVYFKNRNWNYFSLDQIVIIDDTIHWYLY